MIRRGRWAWGLAGLVGPAAIAASLCVFLMRQQKSSILRPESIESLGDSGVGEASEPRVVGEEGASCLTTSAGWPQPPRRRLCFHKLEPLIPPLVVDESRIRVALPLWKLPPGLRSDGILFPEEPTGVDGFALVDISVTAERLVHADRCPESLQNLRAQFVDEEGRQHLLCEGLRPGDPDRNWMTHAVLSDLGGKAAWGQAFPVDRRFLSDGDHFLFGVLQGRLILASGHNNHWYVQLVGVAHGEHMIPLPYSFHVAQGTLIATRRESDVEDDGEELGYWRTSIDLNGVARHERLRSPPIAARPTLWGYPPARPSEREPPVFGSEATGEPELLLPIPLPPVTDEDVPTGQAIRFSLDGAIPLGGLKTAGPEAVLREQGEDLVLHCSAEGPPLTVTTGSHLYARAICDSDACVAVYLAPLRTNFETSYMDDPEFHILRADRERCR